MSRVPPHNVDSEMALLGAVLLRNEVLDLAGSLVDADGGDFYLPKHAEIWRAMASLRAPGQPVDPITLEAELERRGALAMAGGIVYLGEMQARVPTAENAEYYAAHVRDLAALRRLVAAAQEIVEGSYAPREDLDAWFDRCEQSIFEATQRRRLAPSRPLGDAARDAYRELERRAENPSAVAGVPTGFPEFDSATHGLQPSELILVAARPSAGKSTWGLNVAVNAGRAGVPVLFVTIEMSERALGERALLSEARVDGWRARSGYLGHEEWGRVTGVVDPIAALPIEVDEHSRTIAEIRASARRFLARHRRPDGQGLIVVDYLQIVEPARDAGHSREERIAWVGRQLKALAKALRVPVLALCQLNRAAEESEEPSLRHLRESGALEQDADVVAFLHRPDPQQRSRVDLLIRKQRNGPLGDAHLVFLEQYTRFESAARTGGTE